MLRFYFDFGRSIHSLVIYFDYIMAICGLFYSHPFTMLQFDANDVDSWVE